MGKASGAPLSREASSSPSGGKMFPFFTKESVFAYYIPLSGCLSYQAFAFHVYHPRGLARLFPTHHLPIANCLLFNSHIGVGLYLYSRPHIRLLPVYHRIMYSVYGSVLLNFGSILLWATTKALLPDSPSIRFFLALTTSFSLLTIGREYLQYIDKSV